MAISIPSDLVLDVVRAADPVAQQNATMRLGTSSVPGAPATEFASLATQSTNQDSMDFKDTYSSITNPAFLTDASSGVSRYNMSPKRSDLGVKFEAMLLNQFLGEMLPRDSEAFFGKGTAGEIWRSMMAEQLGDQLAKSHAVGLADYLKIPNSNKTVSQG
ncbi:Rod binding protein [Cohaesibacter sp. ES.047]|uniref:rod-binding protein n=1 Tax=Cohaesibacter sp. ES.047 TaxID=1798205 RepID=UPI000BB8186C|nr:rod-binding protein [Cohaesibacter sp. ES.047]SNY92163.1 Rod binding protein [Cohaesibacter sp. ES.047]